VCPHVVMYGCETWSFTVREENRLRMLDNRMTRRVFGSKGDEVTGEWKKNYLMRSSIIRNPHQIFFE